MATPYATEPSDSGTAHALETRLAGGRVDLRLGDALVELRTLADQSVDAVVTDPPYAIRAGESDDDAALMDAAMLGMQSQNWHARATHSRGYADNDPAAFARWCTLWLSECRRVLKPGGHLIAFGGTRTWHRLACAVEDAGFEIRDSLAWLYDSGFPKSLNVGTAVERRRSTGTPADSQEGPVRDWNGWGTTLKPAHEPIVLARKELASTVATTVEEFGTGALNIDGTRAGAAGAGTGRWPGNVLLDERRAAELDRSTQGSASRAFFVAKPNARERPRVGDVAHPTVKPLALMRHLVRLVTPPEGIVLDPFAGSGTTLEAALLEGFRSIGIEREPDYAALIEQRVRRARAETPSTDDDLGDLLALLDQG